MRKAARICLDVQGAVLALAVRQCNTNLSLHRGISSGRVFMMNTI
jgi:hypothetical protein